MPDYRLEVCNTLTGTGGASDVKINMNKKEKQVRISISGSVDEPGAQEMENFFENPDILSAEQVILDFREVGYIGSAGVGTLLLLYKKIAPGNGEVIIENIPPDIYRLLAKDMNLGHIFTMRSL
ncbi:MAG: STAS domain-containing protein [Desulfococcaceae bacterium]